MGLTIALFFSVLYGLFITYHQYYWTRVQDSSRTDKSRKKLSIVIVARNEAEKIEATLKSIFQSSYPQDLYEIILVDDHSSDDTAQKALAQNFSNLKILFLKDEEISVIENSYKKAGQLVGIRSSKHEIILTTDADCICTSDWIETMVAGLGPADIATGPIDVVSGENTLLGLLQRFDNIATMMTTAVGITTQKWFSANAANMIFKKEVYLSYFEDVNYKRDSKRASGDDVMLIQWGIKKGKEIRFIKEKSAIIKTEAVANWKEFFNQRRRWATKTSAYQHKGLSYVWIFVFLFDLALLSFLVLSIFLSPEIRLAFIIMWGSKTIADAVLLSHGASFFPYKYPLYIAPLLSLLHSVYVIIIGTTSLFFKTYSWKGREVK